MPSVDNYINAFSKEVQLVLQQIRHAILEQAPNAIETINYAIPAYKYLGKPLIYFAGYKNHIGLYATPTGHAAFAQQLVKYKQGKGSVQFPLLQPMPLTLIKKIVAFKIKEIEKSKKL